jgi:uncharacterized protein (DUF433 family)
MTPIKDVIVNAPNILGGTPVFCGTRVPLQALLDSIEGGETLDEFLEGFPSVTRAMAIAAFAMHYSGLAQEGKRAIGSKRVWKPAWAVRIPRFQTL